MALAPKPAALALTIATVLASGAALAAVEQGDSGNSHASVWRVHDLGLYVDSSVLDISGGGEAVLNAIELWKSADPRLPHVWPVVGHVDEVGYRSGQKNRNTIRFAAEGEARAKGALAITIVTYNSEQLTIDDADIIINGAYAFDDNGQHPGKGSGEAGRNAYDIGDVLAHEMGHFFGLPDNMDDSSAIMYPLFDAGETRPWSLGDSDLQALDSLYSGANGKHNQPASCSVTSGPRYLGAGAFRLGAAIIAISLLLQKLRRTPGKARRPLRAFSSGEIT